MSSAQLIAYFDRISEAPQAMSRLRGFILGLAVRGKLVEQDPNDEPASKLLRLIQAEKARLVKKRTVNKQSALPSLDQRTLPFPLPSQWMWLRLSDVGILSGGMTPSKNRPDFWDGDVNWFSPKDVKSDELFESELKITCAGVIETGLQIYSPGCLFMVARSGILKRTFPVAINRVEGTVNQDLKVLTPFLGGMERYLQIMFRGMTDFVLSALVKTGTTVQSLKYEEFELQPVPIPPLAEQHRIVAKVDELMALCDRLEAAQAERENRRITLLAASLHRLNNGDDTEAFRKHARFYLDHLPPLTTCQEHIQRFRQTIRNLAMRGKLVPQDPHDQPVCELLKRIRAEKSDNEPFAIPISWEWVPVDQIGDSRLGKMLDKAKNRGTPRRYLRNVNVRWFDFDLSDIFEMRFEDAELDEFALRSGDVLICEGGEPGRAAVWDEREKDIYFQKAIHRVRFPQGVDAHFFVNAVRESADSGRLCAYFTGVGIKHFTGKGLSSFVFPVPPLAEQHRIVAKIDELMALCDRLEAQLIGSQTQSQRLLESVLHHTLTSTCEPDRCALV